MSANYFETKDVKVAKSKCKDESWLKLDVAKTKKNKNAQQPTYYIPITAKNVAGKRIPLSLRFARQVIASSAKIPYGVSDEEAKDVRISFRKLSEDDFADTDYEPEKVSGLLSSNHEFVEALNIIADEYLELVENEVLSYKGDKFRLNKNKTVNCFRQTHRDAGENEEGDEEGKVALEDPIFRIKIPADQETKKLGFNSEKTGHIYVVFDMMKAAKAAKESADKKAKPVVAKIKTANGYVDLTVSNAKHFITYMSLTGGMIQFDSICISKSGISLMCRFKELHVCRHKPMKMAAMDEEAVNDMAEYGTAGGDEDVTIEEPAADEQPKKPTKGKNRKDLSKALDNDDDDEAPIGNDEPAENSGEDSDEKPKSKKPAPKQPAKPSKPVAKKGKKPVEEEPEESAEEAEPEESAEEVEPEEEAEEVEADEEPEEEKPKAKAKPTTGGNLKPGARSK